MQSCHCRPIARAVWIALLAGPLAIGPARADIAGQQVVSGQASFDKRDRKSTRLNSSH